ncbi:MAG TPA: hypothetical protein PKY38_04150 [Opitutaceae bacterium]|nr:hypothetical protein [Opitutaceae bacterium]
MSDRKPADSAAKIIMVLFGCALLGHFWLATRNWSSGFMPGHEFRQTQTALISHFIDREDDFSLLYETPIVGKPWVSILLEVPLYEWSVVLLSRAADIPQVEAARSITLACFYLTLPALWLLLGRLGLPPDRRLLPLILILLCPVYIFYSRAFLMESMELMCCAWFLVGFVGMMDHRRWPWFVLTAAAGAGAALIKSATFAVWLLPAAAYGAWQLWRDLRSSDRWRASAQTVFWGFAGVVVPLGLLRLWIMLTDPIKAAHASAWIFTSGNLSLGNWGLDDLAARFSGSVWRTLMDRWREALMPAWLLLAVLGVAWAAVPRERRRIAGLASVFFLAQLLFPYAYAYQEYYFYACAVFLLAGFGCALHGLIDSPRLRWLGWSLMGVLAIAQLHTYWREYRPQQLAPTDGGFSYTLTLRDFTPRDSVIIGLGADWAAILPYYTERRALMIRNGLEHDRAYLERAFRELWDEDVSALVLLEGHRGNTLVRELAVAAFDLDPTPTFSHPRADVYCRRLYVDQVRRGLSDRGNYGDIQVPGEQEPPPGDAGPTLINSGLARSLFHWVSPAPIRGHFSFGMGAMPYDGEMVFNAHPDSDLWLRAPAQAARIEWVFGMISSAWEKAGDKSDGVEMRIAGVLAGRGEREIYRRRLDPVANPADRGRQHEVIPYHPEPGEILHFSSRPVNSRAYDWAYWARIEVR